jgi:RNase H-like domain found in reverse transcriptase
VARQRQQASVVRRDASRLSGGKSGSLCPLSSQIGGVLQQRRPGGHLRTLGFYLAKLDNAQLYYRPFDGELLPVFLAIRYFRFMLEGRRFIVFTEHRPLVGALRCISEPWSARQQWQLSFISEFTANIRHTPE